MLLQPRLALIMLAAVLALGGFTPRAAHAADFFSPRTSALGGSGHAGPLLNDAIYLNPSYVSFLPTYAMSGNYSFWKPSEDFHGTLLNGSIQDGRSEMFQAGVGYTQSRDMKSFNIGASKSLINKWGIGLGGKLILPNDKSRSMIRDFSAASTLVGNDWFQSAVTVDNILASDESKSRGMFREVVVGTKFNLSSIVLAYVDPQWSFDGPAGGFGHAVGLEFPILNDFFLRMGEFQNIHIPWAERQGRGYGIGAGWIAPRLSVDYGISRMVEPVVATAHTLGMTIFF